MKNQPLLYGIPAIVLVAALLVAGCTSVFPGSPKATPTPVPPTVPATVPPVTPGGSSCGFTTCHGTDLACGMNAPQICTAMYQLGDRCRQYASCDSGNGSCTLVTTPKYAQCKACAERCQVQAGPDNLAAFSCEEKC
jgi:hypothetical protein